MRLRDFFIVCSDKAIKCQNNNKRRPVETREKSKIALEKSDFKRKSVEIKFLKKCLQKVTRD